MARPRTITRDEYERYVKAFTEYGPNYSKVAEVLGVAWKSAKLAWESGWDEEEWAGPIRNIYGTAVKIGEDAASVEREVVAEVIPEPATHEPDIKPPAKLVRAEPVERRYSASEAQLMLDAAIAKIRADVASALLEEQQSLQVARNNVAGILISVDKMLAYVRPLVEAMMSKIAIMASDTSVTPETVLKLIGQIMKVNKGAIEQGAKLLEMQRLLVGAPQSITESRTTEKPAPLSDVAETERARLESMWQNAQRRMIASADTSLLVGESSVDTDDVTDE